jgi:Predicted membrane protein
MKKLVRWIEGIIKAVLKSIYKLLGKELTEEQWSVWVQFVGFAMVGVSNFLVSYGVYALFLCFQTNYHFANIMAFLISVLNAFFWNNRFVFKQDQDGEQRVWWKTLLKTYLSYAFSGLFLTEILLYAEITVLGLPKLLGPVINLVITTPINFFMNKFWAFRSKKTEQQGGC